MGDPSLALRALLAVGLERIELAEAIWDSIAKDAGADELPGPEGRRRKLDRRLADREVNPAAGSPWDEAQVRLGRRG